MTIEFNHRGRTYQMVFQDHSGGYSNLGTIRLLVKGSCEPIATIVADKFGACREVHSLTVVPSERNKRYGTLFLTKLFEFYKHIGVRVVVLQSISSNHHATKLYTNMGMSRIQSSVLTFYWSKEL